MRVSLMGSHFFWKRPLPGMLSWKFAFMSFTKVSRTFLASASPESQWEPWKNLKFTMKLEETFVSQKIQSFDFCSFHQANLSPRQKEITHFTWRAFLKKWSKLNLWGYWSHVLINSTIFATFKFLISVLLCRNLDSIMLKYEGPLIITFSRESIVYRNNYMKDKTFPFPFFSIFAWKELLKACS